MVLDQNTQRGLETPLREWLQEEWHIDAVTKAVRGDFVVFHFFTLWCGETCQFYSVAWGDGGPQQWVGAIVT